MSNYIHGLFARSVCCTFAVTRYKLCKYQRQILCVQPTLTSSRGNRKRFNHSHMDLAKPQCDATALVDATLCKMVLIRTWWDVQLKNKSEKNQQQNLWCSTLEHYKDYVVNGLACFVRSKCEENAHVNNCKFIIIPIVVLLQSVLARHFLCFYCRFK